MIKKNPLLFDTLNALVDDPGAERSHDARIEYVRKPACQDELEEAREKLRTLIEASKRSLPGKPWNELRDELMRRAKSGCRP